MANALGALARMILAAAVLLGVLLAWRYGHALTCAALAIPALLTLVLTAALSETAVARRRCLARCYFRDQTLLRRFFSSGLVVRLVSFFVAAFVTAALCLDLAIWGDQVLLLLGANALLVMLLLGVVRGLLASSVQAEMATVLTRSWAGWINFFLLLAALTWLKYVSPLPDYGHPQLSVMIQGALDTVGSACPWINEALAAQMYKEAVGWWLIAEADSLALAEFGALGQAAAWTLFLVSGSFSAYAYSRLMAFVLHAAARSG